MAMLTLRTGFSTPVLRNGALDGGPVLQVVGPGDNHWPMVHVDDLAEGYRLAAECGLSSEIFNLGDGATPKVRQMVAAIIETAGYEGRVEFVPEREAERSMGAFAEALALDLAIDSRKASRLLAWQPRHRGFLADVPTYLAAWKAAQD